MGLCKVRFHRYQSMFALLFVSFTVMLLMSALLAQMRINRAEAGEVQRQCLFRTVYRMDSRAAEGAAVANLCTWGELSASMPKLSHGVLSVTISVDADEWMPYCQPVFLFGAYEQVRFPLLDQNEGENGYTGPGGVYVGESYLPYLFEEKGTTCVRIGKATVPVAGVLADITGRKSDDRILFLTETIPEALQERLEASYAANTADIGYLSNDPEGAREVEQVTKWLSQNRMFRYEALLSEEEGYTTQPGLNMYFVEQAVIPIFLCGICNCLLIINVYIKKMKRNIYIRRMCGMSSWQLLLWIAGDYGLILLPESLLLGVWMQHVLPVAAGMLFTFLFAVFSIVLIRMEFRREGRFL